MGSPRRWRSRAVATLAVLVLGANCSNGDDPDDGRPARPAAIDGIRMGLPGPLALDPAAASLAEPSQLMTADLLYDGLTAVDAAGAVIPAVASSWSADAAQRVWTFRLDPEHSFTSGRTVTAGDVVASLQRLVQAGDGSLAALRLETVTGFRDFVDGAAPALAGIRAVDDATVEIALDQPLATLPVLLGGPSYGIVDAGSLDAALLPDGAPPELSGDWSAVEAPDGSLTLERRPGRGSGDLELVELVPHGNPSAAYEAFEAGLVDWAEVPDEEVGDAVERYGDEAFRPFHAELLLGLNLASPILAGQPELRAAIVQAVDRDAIVAAVYPDLAVPLDGIVPDGVPGRSEVTCASCSYDPAAARRRLAAAYPDGAVPTVHVDYDRSPAQEALARIVAESLAAVGIPTELRGRSLADYQQFVVDGGHELFTFGWLGAYASPDAYLHPLFQSTSDDNLVELRDAAVDARLADARSAPLSDATTEAWRDVERAVLDASVVIPIAQFRTQVVVADRVQGLRHGIDGTVAWSRVSVD